MEIDMNSNIGAMYYFSLNEGRDVFESSYEISKLFKMSLYKYHKTLIKEVIKHKDFVVRDYYDGDDIVFSLGSTNKETYINRFKEVFSPQLTLLTLGGRLNEY